MMIWVGRHRASPNIRLIFQSTDQRALPKGHVRLRILHVDSPRIGGEVVGEASQMRRLVRPEKDQAYADDCVLLYLKLKNGSPSLSVQEVMTLH